MRRWLRRIPRPKLLASLASLFALYLVLAGYALPRYLEGAIPEYIARELKRDAGVGSVSVNPLLFKLEITGFTLAEADGRSIAAFRRLLVDFELSSLFRWAWTFSTIALDGLELRLDIDPEGRLNLAELAASFPKGESAGEAERDAPPPRLVLQHLEITDAAVTFSDRSGAQPRFDTVRPLALELRDLTTLPDRKGPYSVTARLPGGASLSWSGEVSLQPIVSLGDISLRGAKPASVWRFFQEELGIAEPEGEIDLQIRYRAAYARGAAEVKLEHLRLAARGIGLEFRDVGRAAPLALGIGAVEAGLSAALETGPGGVQATVGNLAVKLSRVTAGEARAPEPLVTLQRIALEGGSFDLRERRVAATRLAVTGGLAKVERAQDGQMRLLELAAAKAETPRAEKPRPAPASGGRPWRLALDAFDVEGLKIALADHGSAPPVAYDIDPLTVAVRNIRNEGDAPIRLDAALRIAQGGSLRVSGEASPSGSRAAAKATLERLSLKPLQPAVASRTALALDSAEVSAALQAQYRAVRDRHEVRAGGSARLENLLLNEARSGERILEWKSVTASGIAFSLAPDRLSIADIVVNGLGAKILVNKDRSVNLVQAMTPPGAPAKPEAEKPTPAADPQPPFPFAIERVRVDNAFVDFSDLSLVLPFAARIQEFNGSVLGLSSDRASRALARLEGRVDEFGLARVDGSLATYDPKAFLDLTVAFRNVEMSPLSPYSATFAGRRIAAGRLGLDLQYKIDKGALAGENKVELSNFTLGERVEAPGALNLPLDLAVALLTDADGKIALAVPVKGNVDDPQFSYGHLVWQAITTVLTNIVTAPFRALFGGGGEGVENIAFDAGRAALLPPEREKLKRLAEALGKRPQLKVVIEGQFGEADQGALRRRDVAAAIARRLEVEFADDPPPVNARDARTQRALEALLEERASKAALDAFVAELEKARGKPVDRVGPLAALTGRASADGEFYDALLGRLVETAPLAADALGGLAAARGAAVAEHLVKALAVPPARVQPKNAAAAGGERAKLALEVATRQ
jgi:uncharacterized protein involved in outer membrane biogenesis